MIARADLVLAANARLPSQRAQALQVLQAASAFARRGAATALLHARRRNTPALPPGQDVFEYYAIPAGPRPSLSAVPCVDWIDSAPRALQYAPARIQELTFARNAARRIVDAYPHARVLSRELETARDLVRGGRRGVFLELHRVPGGATRRRWLRQAAAGAAGVVAISEGVRDDLLELGVEAGAVRVEHDALDPARFEAAPERAAARAELDVPAAARLVVYTGGLLRWKGVDELVEAARELPEVRFVIAGGMPADVERVRARAAGADNVRLDGFQPPARVATYLAAADVAVVPNRSQPRIASHYTSPLKVFEAMAAGVPLVASDVPALSTILERERDAVLVAPDDPAALAAGIERLLADEQLRARMAAQLRGRAATHTWDARAERILDWMESRS